MIEVPGVSPDDGVRGPHGIGDEWLSFESRMRRRRLAKCLLRADLAIEDGDVDSARSALDEALQLDPDSTEAAALAERLSEIQAPSVAAARPPRRSFLIPIAYGTGLLLLAAGGAAFASRYWTSEKPPPVTTVAAVEPAAATAIPAPKPDPERLEIVHETLTVPQARPRLVEDLPLILRPPIANAEPEPRQVLLATNRATETAPPASPEVRSELPAALPDRPVPTLPERAVAPPPDPPDPPAPNTTLRSEPPAARTEGTDAVPASLPRDESTVRAVLEQYESAYSSLDASAASAVWPGVNKSALARAFDGLASQRVSLGACDVAVNGPAARATCSGSATWEPKVGGGLRTEGRRWNFELRKSGDAWQIERAVAARSGSNLR